MVERRERGALAARGHVGAAEIGDDIDADEAREERPVADLPGAALGRAVQDRVAVKADEVECDLGMARAELGDGFGMEPGQLGLDLSDIGTWGLAAEDRAQPLAEGIS